MSATSSPSTRHLAKDGFYYATYQEKRDANIRFNEERLKEKGLDAASFSVLTPRTTAPKKTNHRVSRAAVVTPPPSAPRRSSRRKRLPPEFLPLETDEVMMRRSAQMKPVKKRRIVANAPALTLEERKKLKDEEGWLDSLETYLIKEEGLSQPNFRSVMRQVEKLVGGVGITYNRWDDGVFFMKGTKVALTDDFDKLYDAAVDFEDEHGKDLGNGWLIRHPIKKLKNFQLYLAGKT